MDARSLNCASGDATLLLCDIPFPTVLGFLGARSFDCASGDAALLCDAPFQTVLESCQDLLLTMIAAEDFLPAVSSALVLA